MNADPKKSGKKKRAKHSASIIQREEDRRRCFLCMLRNDDYSEKMGLEKHHVIFGQGRRKKSEADGLTVMLCREHHYNVHHDDSVRRRLSAIAQKAWEDQERQRDSEMVRKRWLDRYGRNYRGD